MAIIKNKVNELLYSAPQRITGATVKISAGTNTTLVVPKNSVIPVPQSSTFTASITGYIQPIYKWSYRYGDSDSFTELSSTENPLVLPTGQDFYAEFGLTNTALQIKVEVSETPGVGTFGVNSSSDIISVPVIREGSDGVSLNSVVLTLYKRTTTSTAPSVSTSGNTTYSFNNVTVVGQPTGWTLQVPSNSFGPYLWSISIPIASQSLSYTFANTTWSAPIQLQVDGIKGTSTAIIYAYKRSATTVTDNPGSISYSFLTNSIENTVLANEWQKTIPNGLDPLYVTTATAASNENSVIILDNQWTTPSVLATSGITVATVYLYLRNNNSGSAPVISQTGQCSYDFVSGVLSGAIPSGWSQILPTIATGSVLWVMQATAASNASSDIIQNTEWSTPRILTTGSSRGIRQLYSNNATYTSIAGYQYSTAAAGADSYALKATELLAASTTAEGLLPTTPLTGDLVTFTNGTNFVYTISYNASISAWEPPGTIIDGSLLVTNSITASKINTNGLTIRDNSGNIIFSAGVPLTSDYLDSSITTVLSSVNDKISKTSNSTLAATLSVSAIAGAGFKAGTITWDNTGSWTSGKGVVMTAAGIMAHNGSKTTFNLNANTGDATFGGVAQSADGKFVIDFVNKTISITV